MPVCRWCEHLAWAGSLTMALVGCIVLLSADSDAASADATAMAPASAGTGRAAGSQAPRTLAEVAARHQAMQAQCQQLPVAATVAECRRNADRQRALDHTRLQPRAGASAAHNNRPP
ncbi:MAG: hypothetical protein Q7U26_10240 [Aquabacterium sp.]|nr:hypothetical protein [Aquabacterium sp.]